MTITNRIIRCIDALGENVNSFSKKIDVNQSTVATALKRNNGVNSYLLEKINIGYPIISIEWLVTGKGEMFKSNIETGTYTVSEPSIPYKTLNPVEELIRTKSTDSAAITKAITEYSATLNQLIELLNNVVVPSGGTPSRREAKDIRK